MKKRYKMKKIIQYYPSQNDQNWNREVEKVLPYMDGKGLDIGSGMRSPIQSITRVDIDPLKEPDIISSGDKLPCSDNEYDYIYSCHSFEHFEDQEKVLKEWLRVIKKGGYICMIHPDVEFTHYQKGVSDNPELAKDPYYRHFHEKTLTQFHRYISPLRKFGFIIVEAGVALGKWSFYFILRKI